MLLNEKQVDYEKMNTLIIPINKVAKKGVNIGEIKISTAITTNMNGFFNYPKSFHISNNEKGKLIEEKKVELEIFENLSKINLVDNVYSRL